MHPFLYPEHQHPEHLHQNAMKNHLNRSITTNTGRCPKTDPNGTSRQSVGEILKLITLVTMLMAVECDPRVVSSIRPYHQFSLLVHTPLRAFSIAPIHFTVKGRATIYKTNIPTATPPKMLILRNDGIAQTVPSKHSPRLVYPFDRSNRHKGPSMNCVRRGENRWNDDGPVL